MDIRSVNLNLLVAFDALIEERSVTRAARRVGVTQPALSASLGRLRALFEDPLFRRAAHGLEPRRARSNSRYRCARACGCSATRCLRPRSIRAGSPYVRDLGQRLRRVRAAAAAVAAHCRRGAGRDARSEAVGPSRYSAAARARRGRPVDRFFYQ